MKVIIQEIIRETNVVKREFSIPFRKLKSESMEDFYKYIECDFIPNELLKNKTSRLAFPNVYDYLLKK